MKLLLIFTLAPYFLLAMDSPPPTFDIAQFLPDERPVTKRAGDCTHQTPSTQLLLDMAATDTVVKYQTGSPLAPRTFDTLPSVAIIKKNINDWMNDERFRAQLPEIVAQGKRQLGGGTACYRFRDECEDCVSLTGIALTSGLSCFIYYCTGSLGLGETFCLASSSGICYCHDRRSKKRNDIRKKLNILIATQQAREV